jgi:transposase
LTEDESQRKGLSNPELSKLIDVSERTIQDWHKKLRNGGSIGPSKHKPKIKQWELGNDGLWYKKSE